MRVAKEIIALNTEGTEHLRRGAFKDAIRCFRTASVALNEAGQEPRRCPKILLDSVLPFLPVPLALVSDSQLARLSPNNMFMMYQQAFSFGYDSFISQNEASVGIVIMFNMGLTYHVMALTSLASIPSTAFSRALKCYKIALSLFDTIKDSTAESQFVLPTLALLVNMGHVYSHYCRRNEAGACQENIQLILESGASLCIPEMEEQFFFEALSYSMYLVHSPASAA
uniref:Cohesin loading complex subunit SCC4 homolog n=1 Tax=Amphora coffeiformis TaxID=265554 RepID=A0A7S3L4Y0_9STRA|eukprot:scaffold2510_cov169-Amphora_coffeaeformis.AAC.29